jgi:hypothetical protein
MRLRTIGTAQVSGLCIGGNPFSGFSHQGSERNREMLDYHTPERIHQVLYNAEGHGINTFFGRTDDYIFSVLRDYWDGGGKIQWFAQVCVERGDPDAWRKWLDGAAELGCTGAYIHGGVVDNWHASERWDLFDEALERMRQAGVVCGFAAHQHRVQAWIRDHLEPDFQMCSYYNPTDRSKSAHHQESGEQWEDADRDAMLEVVATIPRPVVHYKIFAGGNKPVLPAFATLGQAMRENDVALIGVFLKDDPDMISQDVDLFDEHVEAVLA